MSRELRLLQETNRRAREAEAEAARLAQRLAQCERGREQAAREATTAAAATIARLEAALHAERMRQNSDDWLARTLNLW